MRKKLPQLTDELSSDFEARNKEQQALKSFLKISTKYVFISRPEIEKIFNNEKGWDKFYAKFPRSAGIITISRVGFNPQKDLALVYAGRQSHWTAGAGYSIVLKKEKGDWVIKDKALAWIS